jgi:ferredoxin
VPADQRQFIDINARLAKQWPTITRSRLAPPDANEWAQVKNKMDQLDERADNDKD